MRTGRRSFLLATAAALASGAAWSRSLDAIKHGGGRLVAATEGSFAPFNYLQNGRPAGFEVDLAALLAGKMGLGIEWKTARFDLLLAGLAHDRWDLVIASHGITAARARAVRFMAPHYCSGGLIVSRSPAIRTAKDLAGKTVAVQAGTTYMEQVKKLAKASEVREFPTDIEAGSALASGRADAWVTERFNAIELVHRNAQLKLHLGALLFTERVAAAVAKGNDSLGNAWNDALATSLSDGSYALLAKKYFGEDVRCR